MREERGDAAAIVRSISEWYGSADHGAAPFQSIEQSEQPIAIVSHGGKVP
jgi:hypothetical protein